MIVYPNIYKKFKCIGGACNNTCCANWKITLDPGTKDYYFQLDTDFGVFLRENIYEENNMTLIRLTSDERCPFLDNKGLCQVYQNCGPEHMSLTCQCFPRRSFSKGDNVMYSLSLSCEAVLQLLQDSSVPIEICIDGTVNWNRISDVSIYKLTQFIAWGTVVGSLFFKLSMHFTQHFSKFLFLIPSHFFGQRIQRNYRILREKNIFANLISSTRHIETKNNICSLCGAWRHSSLQVHLWALKFKREKKFFYKIFAILCYWLKFFPQHARLQKRQIQMIAILAWLIFHVSFSNHTILATMYGRSSRIYFHQTHSPILWHL